MRLAPSPDGGSATASRSPTTTRAAGFERTTAALRLQRTTMAALVRELTDYAGRPVVDETGLAGEWALTINWMPDVAGGDSSLPSIFTAMREQLGLKLEPVRGAVDVLVIDRAARDRPRTNRPEGGRRIRGGRGGGRRVRRGKGGEERRRRGGGERWGGEGGGGMGRGREGGGEGGK